VIDAIEKLGAEEAAHFLEKMVGRVFGAGLAEAEAATTEAFGAEVGGHDHDGIGKVGEASGGVSEAAFAENLEEQVEKSGVGLFDLVEEDDGEGLLTHSGGEESFGGAGADEAADGVGGRVFGHVETRQAGTVGEKEGIEVLGHFRLAYAGGPDEEQGGDGAARAREAGLDGG